jgi:hypothetical protein
MYLGRNSLHTDNTDTDRVSVSSVCKEFLPEYIRTTDDRRQTTDDRRQFNLFFYRLMDHFLFLIPVTKFRLSEIAPKTMVPHSTNIAAMESPTKMQ